MRRLSFVSVGLSLGIMGLGACSLLNAPDPVQEGGACDEATDCPPVTKPCEVAVCGSDHVCTTEVAADNAACDDKEPCTTGESCQKGVCVGGMDTDCSSSTTECGVGVCVKGFGCSTSAISEGMGCNMGNLCADSACKLGRCTFLNAKNLGGMCDDSKNCTTDDKCDATGQCVGQPKCTTLEKCIEATCDEATGGMCSSQPIPDGQPCEDGNVCTGGETCSSSVCGGGQAPQVLFFDDFAKNNKGWSLGTDWAIGPTLASVNDGTHGTDPPTDHSPTADNQVAGVVLGGDIAPTPPRDQSYLESPSIDVSATAGKIFLTYYRWLNSDYTPYMKNVIEVNDGNGWKEIWASGPEPPILDSPAANPAGPGWTFFSHDITEYKNAALKFRFGVNVGGTANDPALAVGSWNLDDVKIQNAPCAQ